MSHRELQSFPPIRLEYHREKVQITAGKLSRLSHLVEKATISSSYPRITPIFLSFWTEERNSNKEIVEMVKWEPSRMKKKLRQCYLQAAEKINLFLIITVKWMNLVTSVASYSAQNSKSLKWHWLMLSKTLALLQLKTIKSLLLTNLCSLFKLYQEAATNLLR